MWCRDCCVGARRKWGAANAQRIDAYNEARRVKYPPLQCPICEESFTPRRADSRLCAKPECRVEDQRRKRSGTERERLRLREKNNRRRVTVLAADPAVAFTTSDAARLLASHDHCPLCEKRMTDDRGPLQKQLDHIVPIGIGGTHTVGNVRVICRSCNLSRPKDGSDVVAPVLWAVAA